VRFLAPVAVPADIGALCLTGSIIRNPQTNINSILAFLVGVTYNYLVAKKRLPPDIRDFFVKMGRKGGKLGGSVRAANMTAEERSESARKAVQARWAKKKTTK
jgi:hypothetical protein